MDKKKTFFAAVAVAAALLLIFQFLPAGSACANERAPLLGVWTHGSSAGGFDAGYVMTGQGFYFPSFDIGAQYIFRGDSTYEYFWKSRNVDQHDRGKFGVHRNEHGAYVHLYDRVDARTGERKDNVAYYFLIEQSDKGRSLKIGYGEGFIVDYRFESVGVSSAERNMNEGNMRFEHFSVDLPNTWKAHEDKATDSVAFFAPNDAAVVTVSIFLRRDVALDVFAEALRSSLNGTNLTKTATGAYTFQFRNGGVDSRASLSLENNKIAFVTAVGNHNDMQKILGSIRYR